MLKKPNKTELINKPIALHSKGIVRFNKIDKDNLLQQKIRPFDLRKSRVLPYKKII